MGIDPHKVERVTMLVAPRAGAPGPGDEPVAYGIIVRFAQKTDGKQVLNKIIKDPREATFKGTAYLKSKSRQAGSEPLAGFIADERTFLLGPESVLHWMLAAPSGKGELADRLGRANADNDALAVATIKPFRPLLAGVIPKGKEQLPPGLEEAPTLPDRLTAVTAVVNLKGDALLKLTLEANSEASAEVVEKLVRSGLDLVKAVYPKLREDLMSQVPPDLAGPVLQVADQFRGSIGVTRTGNEVIVSLPRPKDFGAAP
jgi:hypothetical protein